MKIAIVYNRDSKRVINLFGMPNQERYGLESIRRISNSLESGGHQVKAFEGDKDLIDNLEDFMPQVVKGERPGMVFNLSYGIQGQARYTHVPGVLEMVGLPYVGSGPLAHALALDKVVSKMIFLQHGLPTPEFAVLEDSDFELPQDLKFPLIVKPKNEAVSFGIKIVENEAELREGAGVIFEKFKQPVLAERYIEGREINVGILGNNPAEALPPAELTFGAGGPNIYTFEDKTRKSNRTVSVQSPADLTPELVAQSQDLARKAFKALGCFDCSRVDMRLDANGKLYILEVNSLPSLGEHGSYVEGARAAGLDFAALVNRLVDVAAARYFGTPHPPTVRAKTSTPSQSIFTFLTQRRDRLEKQVEQWTRRRSQTSDPAGIQAAFEELEARFTELGLRQQAELTNPRTVRTWETSLGLAGGALLIAHVDVPFESGTETQVFRREPEWLYGEGVGSSRAPLVAMSFALRALKHARRLSKSKLGVLVYADEGRDCRYSSELISKAISSAGNVLVLRPGIIGNEIVTARRGQRCYRLVVHGQAMRAGKATSRPDALRWLCSKLEDCFKLSSRKERISVSATDINSTHMPMLAPHRVTVNLLVSYPDTIIGNRVEQSIREILHDKRVKWSLELISDRPPMKDRRVNQRLLKQLTDIAQEWEIPLKKETSVWPSVAGLVSGKTGVLCGLAPIARDIYTPNEAVQRTSLMQRTLLLAEFLNQQIK
jgi:D-alanine-D-alanine ligase